MANTRQTQADPQQRAPMPSAAAAAGKFIWGSCTMRWTTRYVCTECLGEYAKSYFLSRPAHGDAAAVARMTLRELSAQYERSAQLLRVRISELRRRKKMTQDAQELFWLERRMAALAPMLRQMNELAELTAHYYERGYDRNEGYRV